MKDVSGNADNSWNPILPQIFPVYPCIPYPGLGYLTLCLVPSVYKMMHSKHGLGYRGLGMPSQDDFVLRALALPAVPGTAMGQVKTKLLTPNL